MHIQQLLNDIRKFQLQLFKDNVLKEKNLLEIVQILFDILECFLNLAPRNGEDEELIAIRELTYRVYKSLQSVTLLCMSGLEIPALSFLRDVVEIEYLLMYFIREPEKIKFWWHADRATRNQEFRPVVIRQKIAGNDRDLRKRLDLDYAGHSDILTHPTSTSLKLQKGIKIKSSSISHDKSIVSICLSEIAFHGKIQSSTLSSMSYEINLKD